MKDEVCQCLKQIKKKTYSTEPKLLKQCEGCYVFAIVGLCWKLDYSF